MGSSLPSRLNFAHLGQTVEIKEKMLLSLLRFKPYLQCTLKFVPILWA